MGVLDHVLKRKLDHVSHKHSGTLPSLQPGGITLKTLMLLWCVWKTRPSGVKVINTETDSRFRGTFTLYDDVGCCVKRLAVRGHFTR